MDVRAEALQLAETMQADLERLTERRLRKVDPESAELIRIGAMAELAVWADRIAHERTERARAAGITWRRIADAAGLRTPEMALNRLGPGRQRDRERKARQAQERLDGSE